MTLKTILILVISMATYGVNAQSTPGSIQIGAAASTFKNGNAYGGEIIISGVKEGKASVGFGAHVLKFEGLKKVCIPSFITASYIIPMKKFDLYIHADPGYTAYDQEDVYPFYDGSSVNNIKSNITGGFYLGTGIGIKTTKSGAYLNLQYSMYNFSGKVKASSSSVEANSTLHGISLTAGVYIFSKQ